MTHSDLKSHLTQWRQAEDKFYASVMGAPELYTAGINLVRAITDQIDADRVEALLDAYNRLDIAAVTEIAEATNLPQRDFLDYHLARESAFYLRYQEILEEKAKTEIQRRIDRARARSESWVTLYNNEQEGQGVTFFQRLDMHLPDGMGLYSAIELDWEKGRVYVVEPLVLDPHTGEPRREVKPPDPRQEFARREEMVTALAALRQKYEHASTVETGD